VEQLTEAEELIQVKRELQEVKRLLLESQKASSIGVLASSITHEFNNILTTVINYAKMGVRHKDAATRDKAFDKILAASHRATKITTGMLSYARAKADRREPMDLVTLVEDVLFLVEKDLQMHRVRLETQFEGRPWANVNSGQIQQVVLNLIVNGRQAMTTGGTLIVSVKPGSEGEFVEIAVRDTGSGIPADKLRQIFEPFFSTKTADAQGQGGTGLGLSLAREVMESHQGRIKVESTVGRGTCFTLKLPAVIAQSAVAQSNRAQTAVAQPQTGVQLPSVVAPIGPVATGVK
jgi:signal transduction histidine kinase